MVSKYFRGYRLVILSLVLMIYIGTTVCNSGSTNVNSADDGVVGPNEDYIGSDRCASCHKKIHHSYLTARHYRTSAVLDSTNFKKLYADTNRVYYKPDLYVSTNQQRDGIYQTAYSGGRIAAMHSMDLVIGSGRKGQTFLYWSDSMLYQLPLSYSFAYKRWINSPGYPADKVLFNRPITVKCFECHASYAKQNFDQAAKPAFDSNQMVLGISCETCHGPGKKHLQFHKENPGREEGKFIINAASFTRQQQLDACASCHSGILGNLKPAFSFLPGNKLADFFKPAGDKDSTAAIDVHGNQYGLLTASKCFKMSEMTCSSCHNVHEQETRQTQLFVQRCINCHKENSDHFCKVKNTDRRTLINRCIDCHMPQQASGIITFTTGNNKERLFDSIRTHLVGIYPK
jgi:Cytochrome c554 and c-prime